MDTDHHLPIIEIHPNHIHLYMSNLKVLSWERMVDVNLNSLVWLNLQSKLNEEEKNAWVWTLCGKIH